MRICANPVAQFNVPVEWRAPLLTQFRRVASPSLKALDNDRASVLLSAQAAPMTWRAGLGSTEFVLDQPSVQGHEGARLVS